MSDREPDVPGSEPADSTDSNPGALGAPPEQATPEQAAPEKATPEQATPEPLPGWSREQPPPFGGAPTTPEPSAERPPRATPGAGEPQAPGADRVRGAWTPPPPAPTPGVIPLRPLAVGDIMTGAIDYVRRDTRTVIGISAIMGLAAALLQIVLLGFSYSSVSQLPTDPQASTDPAVLIKATLTLGGIALATAAVGGVLQVLGTGMLTHVMGRSAIGKHTSLGEAWGLVKPQFWRLLAVTLCVSALVTLAIALPLSPGIGLLVAGLALPGALLLMGGLAGAVVLGVWVTFTFVLSTPALALEDCGPIAALKRSRKLVRGAFWRTLGIVFLGSIVAQAVGTVAAVPFSLIAGAGGELTTVTVFATAIGALVTVMVALPFLAGVTALVYLDRRIRTENLATVLDAASKN